MEMNYEEAEGLPRRCFPVESFDGTRSGLDEPRRKETRLKIGSKIETTRLHGVQIERGSGSLGLFLSERRAKRQREPANMRSVFAQYSIQQEISAPLERYLKILSKKSGDRHLGFSLAGERRSKAFDSDVIDLIVRSKCVMARERLVDLHQVD